MNQPTHIDGLEGASALPAKPLHLAIGMFDGVHLGHLAVVEAAVRSAQRTGGVSAALTFDPHPSRLLRPQAAVKLIQSVETKTGRLFAAGLDAVITQPFTRELAAVTAAAFVPSLRQALPQLRAIYVGENWRFGQGRQGDLALLNAQAQMAGLTVFSSPRVNWNGEPISSTRIRAALEAGQMEQVNALLGHTYQSHGAVVSGRRLGRDMGFPTLNLPWWPDCAPRFGVYAVRVQVAGGTFDGVANYGVRPTVAKGSRESPLLEVHLLEATTLGRGDELKVDWCAFLRPERRFAGVKELRTQIAHDLATARSWFQT